MSLVANLLILFFRREHRASAAFSIPPEVDSELLDFEDHLSSPASFYAGTGGKPPLSFSLSDPKSQKRYVHSLSFTPECPVGVTIGSL